MFVNLRLCFLCSLLCIRNCSSFCQGVCCAASDDSILKYADYGMPIRGKGGILYSDATAQFTMDYSIARDGEEEVNSPPPRPLLASVLSPSPLRPRRSVRSPSSDYGRAVKGKSVLFDAEVKSMLVCQATVCSPFALSFTPFPPILFQCTNSDRLMLNMPSSVCIPAFVSLIAGSGALPCCPFGAIYFDQVLREGGVYSKPPSKL